MKKKIFYPLIFLLILLKINLTFTEPFIDSNKLINSSESKRIKTLTIIEKSENEYEKGIELYNRGEYKQSRKHFRKTLKILSANDFEHNFLYDLSDEFNDIFHNLNERLNLLLISNGTPPKMITSPLLLNEEDELVKKYIKFFTTKGQRSLIESLERMGLYKEIILKAIHALKLPEELIYLPVLESNYLIKNVSRAKASGLWQFMKHTARAHNLRVDFWIDERRDPEKSTLAALRYLKELYFYFNDWNLALAGYNRGENGLGRDLLFSKATDFSILADNNTIPAETENFVPKLMAIIIIAKNPEKYNLSYNEKSPLKYDSYETDQMIDLKVIAKCANVTKKDIQKLNPAILAWCTPKNYPNFKLKIPYGSLPTFTENLKGEKELCPSRECIKYRVKRGDVLGKIAAIYKTSVRSIQEDNKIKNVNKLMPGDIIIINPGRAYYK